LFFLIHTIFGPAQSVTQQMCELQYCYQSVYISFLNIIDKTATLLKPEFASGPKTKHVCVLYHNTVYSRLNTLWFGCHNWEVWPALFVHGEELFRMGVKFGLSHGKTNDDFR